MVKRLRYGMVIHAIAQFSEKIADEYLPMDW
jgi:hypothetical protein